LFNRTILSILTNARTDANEEYIIAIKSNNPKRTASANEIMNCTTLVSIL
jgi:hypothetical protein